MQEFKTAKMDGRTRLLTVILLILLPVLAISSFFFEPQKLAVSIFLSLLFIAVIFISYAFVPKRIALSAEQILIQNLYGTVVIHLNEIKSVERLEKVGFNFRTFGVGGLFGYFGYFNGRDVWYVTNIYKKIKITLHSGKIYMLSPENPELFIDEIRKISAKRG